MNEQVELDLYDLINRTLPDLDHYKVMNVVEAYSSGRKHYHCAYILELAKLLEDSEAQWDKEQKKRLLIMIIYHCVVHDEEKDVLGDRKASAEWAIDDLVSINEDTALLECVATGIMVKTIDEITAQPSELQAIISQFVKLVTGYQFDLVPNT